MLHFIYKQEKEDGRITAFTKFLQPQQKKRIIEAENDSLFYLSQTSVSVNILLLLLQLYFKLVLYPVIAERCSDYK